ncbi:FAD-binding oxidoreductase [Saxibacter everestensis]|uniref:FAD-binding oxidoreductase n=1 Tax=Saxibacter everestensis TaxID=2909229 RepID=A0ABY8QYU4_9MICO|nr:FAD-binding oxidoreductase [Brevibacteriaceae bacterium ZFBP1038]
MTTVKHMKWWGWGVEGVQFEYHNKPNFAPFVKEAVDLDLEVEPADIDAPDLDRLRLPDSLISAAQLARLTELVGDAHVTTERLERVTHTYGKSIRDLLRLRDGSIARVPDVVVYPGTEAEVQQIVDLAVDQDAVLIPFGGGTNISGSLEPLPEETRPIISLDLGRMNRVLEVDEQSGLARVQAGTLGPDLEEQLGDRGWTMGHFPDSFTHSTLGGWVATRSSGMQSDKYGDIAEITRGLRVVVPRRTLVIRPLPGTSTGPSVREMILGSEGRLGVITEVTVQIHRLPTERQVLGYLFPDWQAGLAAMEEIASSDASPSVTRVSDARETGFSFATRKKGKKVSGAVSAALMKVLERKGWDLEKLCLSFIGYEGSKRHVGYEKNLVRQIVRKHGGILLGKGPGTLYDQKKFDTPYIRDFLLDRGAAADVSETAAPWSRLRDLYAGTVAAANAAYREIGVRGWIMCHLSHSEHSGACLYFTFAFRHDDNDPIGRYEVVKTAIQQAFIDNGGTLSHHHAVGREHAPWIEQDLSPAGADMLRGLFESVDPKRNLNPGKIVF